MSKTKQPNKPITSFTLDTDAGSDTGGLTIVGIGASAGGLAALKTFFAHVPEDSGLAFVVVVHLNPDHESPLADLLQPHVSMSVQQVQSPIFLQPNQVYVIPPGCNVNFIDTHLRLSDLEVRRHDRAPIDHFFRTLSETHDGPSVGVILTGTGSDGTLGITMIKGRGGLTIVQDPAEAEYEGMPQSALSTGSVDLVLPLTEMCGQILRFKHTQPKLVVPSEDEEFHEDSQQLLQKVFAQVYSRTGRDFSRYKRSTILRRIQRRMQLHQHVALEDYLTLLEMHPEEVQVLSDEFLITVTNFFRDAQVFEHLEREVIPTLLKDKAANDSIRVWSVGCATGEEAYSLAMLLVEEADRHDVMPEIRVFASDLHPPSLQKAREGYYPEDIEADVSAERLQRFFIREGGGYRIRKEVRDRVVFTPHNLLADPPFSRIDLVACRNLLIYLQRPVQREAIELFHYALQPEGYLLIGPSEIMKETELFRAQHKRYCLFQKRNVPAPKRRLPVFPQIFRKELGLLSQAPPHSSWGYGRLHQQTVERFAPPSLLVGPDDTVTHLSERVGRYLTLAGGEATYHLYKLVRQEFRLELRQALRAAQQGEAIKTNPVLLTLEGQPRSVILSVFPAEESVGEGFSVVVFDEREPLAPSDITVPTISLEAEAEGDLIVQKLQAELEHTQQQLQHLIGEHESSREAMRASNEEMQSANEELRSTMEELDIRQEELQSMNEELTTLNQENRHKVAELTQLSGDLHNLLQATDIASLFLDRQLRILRFTPQVSKLFNVRPADQGRPLSDITHRLGEQHLLSDAQQVLDCLIPVEREVQDEQQRWYLTRVLPYRSTEERIEGVVLTFLDITERKLAEQECEQAKQYAEQIVASVSEPLLVLTPDLRVEQANQTFYDNFQVDQPSTIGRKIYELGNGQWNVPALRELLEEVLPKDARFHDYEVRCGFEQIGRRIMLLSGRRLKDAQRILISINDITERVQLEEALRQAKEEADRAAQAKEDFLAHMSHEIRTPLNAVVGLTDLLLQNPKEEQLENLQTLKFSAQNLRMLVNDILDLSKIRAGKVMVEEIAVRLSEVLHSLQQAHQLQASEHNTTLQIVLDEQLPAVVRTDSLKLLQVLNNLVSNAVKFTRAGEVAVHVSLVKKQDARLWVKFSVQDTGMGISPDQLTTIFDAFTQADVSTVRQYGGTGLGLSITKLLLELMDSRIEVESHVGKGSCFFFTLPVKEESLPEATSSALPPGAQDETRQQEARMDDLLVLLVEDVAVNRMVLNQFLQAWWSLTLDEAQDGQQAVEMAQQKEYDLILMDVRMPVMDGYQAAQAIRRLPRYQEVPILALTADTVEDMGKHAEVVFFTDMVTKPFDPLDLRQKIMQHAPLSTPAQRKEKNQPLSPLTSGAVSAPPTAPALVLKMQKLEDLFKNDRRKIGEFLTHVQESVAKFRTDFATAMEEGNATAIGDLKHAMKVQADMLGLNELLSLLDLCQTGLEKEENPDQRLDVQRRVEAMVAQIEAALKQAREQLP